MKVISYTVEHIQDPTGILSGERYEFYLDLEVDEEDELSSEEGLQLRVLFYKNDDDKKILNYHFLNSDGLLEFALDEEEEKMMTQFCIDHYLDDDSEKE